jgi:hypothetical protein
MTPVNAGLNAYTQYGTAYARAAAVPSLATNLSDGTGTPPGSNAATRLTLSDAARAQLAKAALPNFSAVTAEARTTLDHLYNAAGVTAPIVDGQPTISLSSLDRRALFAVASNNGRKFTTDEQAMASSELKSRFNVALAPAAATTRLTGDYSITYKAARDYLDAASSEEKTTVTWSTQRTAVLQGYQATQQKPTVAPSGIASDPVAVYLARDPGTGTSKPTRDFASVASDARAFLDRQQSDAANDQQPTGHVARLASLDNRSLSAITLNEGQLFSSEEISAAKTELQGRTRSAVLDALKPSGDPRQLSLGILQSYSAMSPEERQAMSWTPEFQDLAVKNYKSTSSLLSMLQPA